MYYYNSSLEYLRLGCLKINLVSFKTAYFKKSNKIRLSIMVIE